MQSPKHLAYIRARVVSIKIDCCEKDLDFYVAKILPEYAERGREEFGGYFDIAPLWPNSVYINRNLSHASSTF